MFLSQNSKKSSHAESTPPDLFAEWNVAREGSAHQWFAMTLPRSFCCFESSVSVTTLVPKIFLSEKVSCAGLPHPQQQYRKMFAAMGSWISFERVPLVLGQRWGNKIAPLCGEKGGERERESNSQVQSIRKKIEKISFGGIPNSSSIDILMPYAVFDYMGPFLRNSFAHVDKVILVNKTIPWLLLSRLQGNKPHRNSPEPSEPCLRKLHQHAEPSESFRKQPPEPTPAYTGTSEIFRNLPPEPTPFYTGTPRNLPELAS